MVSVKTEVRPEYSQQRLVDQFAKTMVVNVVPKTYDELIRKAWDYDIETLRNYFSAYFIHTITGEELVFEIYSAYDQHGNLHTKDDSDALVAFLKTGVTLFGYNSNFFDNPIINKIMIDKADGKEILPIKLYNLAQMIIKQDETYVDIFEPDGVTPREFRMNTKVRDTIKNITWWRERPYKGVDLIEYTVVNSAKPSLKHCAIQLHHEKIQDFPVKHDEVVTYEQIQSFLAYNKNDVVITGKLRKAQKDRIQLRIDVAETFGLKMWRTVNASDSKLANVILESLWGGKPDKSATERQVLRMDELIGDWVSFKNPELQKLEKIMRRVVLKRKNKYKWGMKYHFDGVDYSIGVGGLHSVDKPRILESGEDERGKYYFFEIDGASYYPGIILALKLFPAHLGEKFLKIYKKIVDDRLKAKKTNPTRAAGLKITINGTFGKMLSKFFWLYDPKQPLTVTVTGQLTLLMLVERLLEIGVHTYSANTDGILVKAYEDQLEAVDKVVKQLAKEIQINWEYTVYKRIGFRDVNNYAGRGQECEIKDGKFEPVKGAKAKTKGALNNNAFGDFGSVNYNRGYASPVVATAVRDWVLDGKPVAETINEFKDNPHAFFITQKVGAGFTQHLKTATKELNLQKTNRFCIASRKTSDSVYPIGSLIKRKFDPKKGRMKDASIVARKMVAICNDLDPACPPPIDYDWYIDAAQDVVNLIGGFGQMNLFGEIDTHAPKTNIFDFVSFDEVDEYMLVRD